MPSELNLILIGPPGAGKGTQADRLRDDFRMPFISTGDMLRTNVTDGTELGKAAKAHMDAGDLVPDDLIVAMAAERLEQDDARDGFILDGFPRTIGQAEALDELMVKLGRRITGVLLLEVPDEEIVKRIAGRRVCVKGGHNYHDKPEVVENRLKVYHDQTAPLVDFYDQRGLLRRIDGTRTPAQVHDHIRAVIATLRLEEDV